MPDLKLYVTRSGLAVQTGDTRIALPQATTLDQVFQADNPLACLREAVAKGTDDAAELVPLAPIQSQEVWAAGVTYLRSRVARVAESKDAGGGTFYDKVYSAVRPELFFKSTPHRVAGTGQSVRIRRDARWNVPEPELTLAISARGRVFGYTVGNDMSSRDIEAENPLYLPQAKVYDQSAALGPCILVPEQPLDPETEIALEISRAGAVVFTGQTPINRIKRSFSELAEFLYRDNSFPAGCFLMTGTGIVPPDDFTLQSGDEIAITIPPIGRLFNTVTSAS